MAITATRTSTLFNDQDGDGQFDPGDIILTQIRITNTGPGPVTGITVTDNLTGVTLDPSSVQVGPIAYDDSFNITGNTPITLTGAQLVGNDDDPDGLESALHVTKINGVSVVAGDGTTPISVTVAVTNGSVTSNVDGTFTFTPTTGLDVNATASFNYTVTDAQGVNSVSTTPGLVNFTITDVAWYVDNTASAAGADGSYLHPFTSLGQLNDNGTGAVGTIGPNDSIVGDDDVDSAGETIFVYHNGGNYSAGISLEAGQKLIGDGQAYFANGHNIGGAERTGGADVLTNAVVSQASGTILVLGTDNTVKGLTFDASGAGAVGMADGNGSVTTAAGTLLVSGVSFTGVGQAIDIDQGGNLNVSVASLTSTGSSGQGVQLAGTASSGTALISGTVNIAGGNIQGATSHDFLIGGAGPSSGGTVAVTYGGTLGGSTTGSAVNIADRIAGAGNISFTGNITNSTGAGSTAAGISLSNIAAGTIDFTGTKTLAATAGTQNAISIANNGGGTVNFSGGAIDIDFATGTTGSGIAVTNMTGGSVNVSTAADIDMVGSANGRGVSISGSTGGTVGFTGGGLTIDTRDGTALFDNNAAAGSTLNISGAGNTLTTTNGGALVDIANVTTGGITFNTLTTGAAVANNTAVHVNNLDGGTFTTTGITVTGTTGATSDGVRIEGGSTTTFNLGSVSVVNTGDDGVELNGANGAVTISSINVQNTAGQGVEIVGATNAVTLTAGTIGSTNDPAAEAVLINGGTGAVTVGATVTKTTAGNVVEVTGHSNGAISFSNTISATGGVDNGIKLTQNTGGAIGFTGNVTLNTGAGHGIEFTNTLSTGAAVTLSGGSLDIDTTTGTGITATSTTVGAGSLTISGATNANAVVGSVASVGGRAINVDGVTATIDLRDVSANGGTSTGIFLKNTGASGHFVITGSGTTQGSGGVLNAIGGADAGSATAASTTGTGIYLENVSNVTLNNMNFTGNFTNFGIRGENVNNFTMRDSNMTGTFGSSAALDEGTIRFGTENNVTQSGLKGTALFEGNTISGGWENNMSVFLYSNDTLNMTVRDNATSGKQAVFGLNQTTQGDDSLHIESGGTGSNFTFLMNAVDFQGAGGGMLDIIQIGQTTQNLTVTNNNFLNTHSNIVSGGGGVRLLGGDTAASSNVNVTYNFSGNTIRGAVGDAFRAIYTGTAGTINGLIANNIIGTNGGGLQGGTAAGSSGGGSGIDVGAVRSAGTGSLTYAVHIDNNTIRDIANAFGGIILTANMAGTTGTSRLEATLTNNTVAEVGINVLAGLYGIVGGQSSAALSQDAAKMGIVMSGNTFTAGSNSGGALFFDQLSGAAQYYFPGYTVTAASSHGEFRPSGGGGTASTSLDTFLDANNVLISGANTFPVGSDVQADQVTNVGNQAFVLPVPLMAVAPVGLGWEDLVQPAATDPNPGAGVEPGTGTPDNSGGGGDTGSGDGGTGGTGGTGDPGTPPSPAPTTPVVNDGILSNAELNFLVDAAIQRWVDAGATSAQVDAMRAVAFGIVDMSGIYVGSSTHGVINIDDNAAGYGWFVDSTPGEDSEYDGAGTRLTADVGGAAAGKLDLLTVLMHELGHQIGLGDEYMTSKGSDLMYGYINVGERRLPAQGEATGAQPGTVGATAFALAPVSVGTLPANKAVDVFFKSTINPQTNGFIVNPAQQAQILADGGVNVTANETLTLDTLTLGSNIFIDANKNGAFDAGEGVQNVTIKLYADTNNDGNWDGGDAFLANATTGALGAYSFTGLAPGNYIVLVNATNFAAAAPLFGKITGAGSSDPDDNVDNDDNGVNATGGAVATHAITLSYNNEGPNFTPGLGTSGDDTNNTLDLGFIAPNAAPTSTNLSGDNASYIEGAAPVKLDVGGNATLNDDGTNFAGGSLTVAIGAGAVAAEDVLSIATTATVTLDVGSTVKVGGTAIGTYAGGTAGSPLVITFNSSATKTNVDDLLQALQYNNTNTVDPSTTQRAVSITLVDGGGTDGGAGADTLVINSTVDVVGVNDAPSGAATATDSTDDTTTLVFDAANFNGSFSDPDHNNFAGIKITSLPSTGKLQLNNVDITVVPATVTLAQLTGGALTFVPDSGTGGSSPTFDFAVYDDGGVANSGVDTDPTPGTFTIALTASNAAPVLDLDADDSVTSGSGFDSAYTEGGAAAAISDTDVSITDADVGDDITFAIITISNAETGDKLNVGALPATVTVDGTSTDTVVKLVAAAGTSAADFEAAIEAITYSSTSDDPTNHGTNMARSIIVTVGDGNSDSNAAIATVDITDVNDDPTGTSATITASEDTFRVLNAADLGFNDVDGTLKSVTISAATGGKIYFDADGAGGLDPVEVVLPQTYTALQLSDGKVSYKANQDLNGAGVGTITFTVTDDDSADAASSNTLTVDVTAVNDSPVLTTGGPIAATEQTAVAILTGASVADVDLDARNGGNGDYGGASVSVNRNPATNATEDDFTLVAGPNFTIDGSNNLKAGGLIFGTISVDGTAGLIVINFTSLETAATSALVDEVMQGIRYTNNSDNPPASVDLSVGFHDGSPGGGQGAGATDLDINLVTVNIAGVNDAPVNSLGGTIGTGEDAVNAWLSGMAISDPDADPATDDIVVTFDVDHGTLTIDTGVVGGITGGDILAQDADTITVKATLNEINATLTATNGLTYSPDHNYNGNDTLTVTTNDQGHNGTDPNLTGDGTSEEDVDTRTITVSAIDDPAEAKPDAVSTPENAIGTGDLFAANGSGADSDPEGDPFFVTAVNGMAVVGTEITLASGAKLTVNADGTYSYNPSGQFNTLTDNSSGAVNTSKADTFNYTITGGSTVTVTMTVNGVAGPGDWLAGDGTDNTITGTPQKDDFRLQQGGNDTVYGLASDDTFYFGAAFTGADKVDGGADRDVVILQGNYTLTLSATNIVDVESISLQSGSKTFWGDTANNFYHYNITTVNANVAPGQELIVNGQSLRAGEDFTFDGSAETDGHFFLAGGRGVDTLKGGAGNDIFVFDGDRWGASDSVDGGAGSRDALIISAGNGLTHIGFGATSLTGIESVSVTNRYASDPAAKPSYEFVLNAGNVAAGTTLIVNGSSLLDPTQTFSVDGTAIAATGKLILYGGAGIDVLRGGAGDDIIYGGLSPDTMTGGGGNDVFRYASAQDSTTSARDGIGDFSLGDILDLSAVDANSNVAGDQAFTFIGSGPFTNQAGQLQVVHTGGGIWVVSGDVDGLNGADFQFTVTVIDHPGHQLTVTDFVF
jgi:hypothetical protein